LVDYLNSEVLTQLCKDEGIPPILKLKFEKYASKVLFVQAKNESGAAKKKYSMRVTWQDGKDVDYIHVVGFDYVRGNASKITRKVQIKCLDEILRGNNSAKSLTDYLNKIVGNIRDGKYSLSDIAIPITLGQPLNQYKVITDYVRAALWSNKNLGMEIVGGDRIKYLPVKKVEGNFPQTDVVAFFDEEKLPKIVPDYDKIIDSTITKKVDQFLRLVGVNWRSVEGSRDLREALY
jgi:DNA polymerase elongation subunit (family B)